MFFEALAALCAQPPFEHVTFEPTPWLFGLKASYPVSSLY